MESDVTKYARVVILAAGEGKNAENNFGDRLSPCPTPFSNYNLFDYLGNVI